ncbi:MAG: C40 family peptidase [Gemmatimonadaceae bacterium]
MLRFSIRLACGAAFAASSLTVAGAQRPDVTLNPFVTFPPPGSPGPLTGLALTVASGPFALRAGGHVSLQDGSSLAAPGSAVVTRPWGADVDAVAYLESITYERVMFTPYVFAGVSTGSVDSAAFRFHRQGWSYGSGAALPLGSALGLFGEMRWRMSRFVMPNADGAPQPESEVRLGIAFRVGGGGGVGHAVPVVTPSDGDPAWNSSASAGSSALRLLSTADEYVGTPYRRGGTSPSPGFDASGFVRFIFSKFGVILPRMSRDQARVGERVPANWKAIAPGDLVMFQDDGGINHVAIYVGGSRIIHSSETGGGVRYDDLTSERGRWFLDHLVAARRVTPDVRGMLLDLARGYSTNVASDSDGPDHAPRVAARRR